MEKPLVEWQSCHALMSGPPCQHCTAIGKQMGIKDALRAEPFFRVMEVAKELDRRGELLVVCYENTPAILLNLQNGVFAELLKEWWSANMPTWTEFDIWTLDAKDHGTRVSRIRVFLGPDDCVRATTIERSRHVMDRGGS